MRPSEKASLEILDEIFNRAMGMHILTSIPIKKTSYSVKIDQGLPKSPTSDQRIPLNQKRANMRSPDVENQRSPKLS